MKKIIYSLVIMIAAGSLFTSCIEPVEPLGIQDMRYAKAEYIRALKDLRAADAEYVRAQAAVEQAKARYIDAKTALKNAQVELQKLQNEYQALLNEARADSNAWISAETQFKIDSLEMAMEELQAMHDSTMVEAEKNLAIAQEQLRIALRDIALAAQSLTPNEQAALAAAVAIYAEAFEAYTKQQPEVMKAQRKVDSLKWAKSVYADQDWNPDELEIQNKVEWWENEKEYWLGEYEYDYAMYQAWKNAKPEQLVADLAEWKAKLDELAKAKADAEYALHEFTEEVTAYYVQYVHDGWDSYNRDIKQWKANHPAVADPGDAPEYTPGQKSYEVKFIKKSDNFKIDDVQYYNEAGHNIAGNGSTGIIENMPALKDKGTLAYQKLNALLDSYKVENPDFPGEGIDILEVAGGEFVLNVGSSMKDFILGTEDGDVDTQKYVYDKENDLFIKASYGLNGAVATLKRDKVLNPDTPVKPEDAKKVLDAAAEAWEKDLDTLNAGIAKYEFYAQALKDLDTVRDSYKDGQKNLFTAVAKLYKVLNDLDQAPSKTYSKNDSIAIVGAVEAFAKARDNYLDDDTEYAKGTNPHYYYVATGKTSAGLTIDSVAFSELASQTKIAPKNFEYSLTDPSFTEITFTDAAKTGRYAAIVNILSQLIPGWDVMTAVDVAAGADIDLNTDAVLVAAQELIPGAGTSYTVDSWEKPTTLTPADYEPSAVTDAKDEVLARVKQFVKIYDRFWATDEASDLTAINAKYDIYFAKTKADDKAKALTNKDKTGAEDEVAKQLAQKVKYTVDTFTKPYFNVVFEGSNILFTKAIGVILGSVDPNAATAAGTEFEAGGYVNGDARVFYGPTAGKTEFYKYMKAMWDYNASLKPTTTSIAEIEEWVAKVAAKFDSAAEGDSALVYQVYQADSTAYEATKAKYDKYVEALEAFTGGKADKGYVIVECNDYSNPNVFFDQTTWKFNFNLAGKDIFGDFDGKWADSKKVDGFVLGGEQLKNAEKYFPGLAAKLKEWSQKIEKLSHEYIHADIEYSNLEKAYFAAAKAKGYALTNYATDYDSWIEVLKLYINQQRDKYQTWAEEDWAEAEKYAKDIAYYYDEAGTWDIAIAEAEADLKIEQALLDGLEKVLALAKKNLDNILAYLKSLDVNFVVPDAETLAGIVSMK